jgi:hypothetical protein
LSCYPVAAAQALNAKASYFAPGQDVSGLTRYLFHDPCALGAFTLPNLLSIASDFRSDESPNIYIRSIEMNNRNQQTTRSTAPAEGIAPTYLNVFTVESAETASRPIANLSGARTGPSFFASCDKVTTINMPVRITVER